ncbi:MAG: hypothetical protein IT270_09570 [Saprospiraceae bacterium]|nr:hypothetical protein [Saprospiraceae bacterium]
MENNFPEEKEHMETLVSVLSSKALSEFDTQFNITDKGLISLSTQKIYQPNQVKVAHFYRFEGESNPDDNSILYAIETNEGEKGTIVDAYGMYSDTLVGDFMNLVEGIHK